ncbi:MAG: ZIP family metal transporter [Candidatus Binatia bacterium]|nr:ZIP family metal transporter [Candidatus Binatia bacterium]
MEALVIFGAACTITLGGGLLALRLEAYRRLIYAFCAGALVAAALVEVVPDALEILETSGTWLHHHHLLFACALGFLSFYLLEHTSHGHETHALPAHDAHAHHAGLLGATGIGVHSFFDGFAIAQGFHASEQTGWAIAVGVILHKLADGVSVAGVMLGTHHTPQAATAMVCVAAFAPIAGVVTQALFPLPPAVVALLLGWFAGVFLYLGAASLLPSAHLGNPPRWLFLVTLGGATMVYSAHLLLH